MKVKTKTGVKMKFFLLRLILLSFFTTKLFSCTGTWSEMYIKDEYYNFTDPDMVNLPQDNPLYQLSGSYTAHDARFKHFAQKKKEANIQAWYDYFQGDLSLKTIEALFYHKNSIQKSAKRYENSGIYPNFSKYINFLHLLNQSSKTANKKPLIDQGLAYFKKERQAFLKERYLYLLMRFYHHNGHYQKALDLYSKHEQIINPKGIVKEWIDSLRAGAYQRLGETLKANQLYAQIFSTHKTNPHYGYYDFKINNDEEWTALINSTQDANTQALYHFLRAMKWGNEPLYELKNIASLAPESVWFERLAYMKIQELQNKRYEIMMYASKKDKYFKAKVKSYKIQRKRFLNIVQNIEKQTFFTLYAKLYLNVLEYNSLKRNNLLKLRALANKKQLPYVKLLTYIYALHQLSSSSNQEQYALYLQLKPLVSKFSPKKQTSILRYTALQISTLNETGSIEKTLNKLFAQNENNRSIILKALNHTDASKFYNYVKAQKRSFFEEKVFKKTMKNLRRKDVAKILATLYLQENNFTQSHFYLRQVAAQNLFSPYNPFNVSISGSNRTKSKTSYSQKRFIETMLRLESEITKDQQSAQDHFLYANGLYNKSWFGNFPLSSVLHRSPYLTKKEKLPKTMDLSLAKQEYELALKYASDENFRAKIAYQLLKIKFNQAITNIEKYDNDTWTMPHFSNKNNGTQKVIDLLKKSKDFSEAIKDYKSDYGHTDYGTEVIEQCVTFGYF